DSCGTLSRRQGAELWLRLGLDDAVARVEQAVAPLDQNAVNVMWFGHGDLPLLSWRRTPGARRPIGLGEKAATRPELAPPGSGGSAPRRAGCRACGGNEARPGPALGAATTSGCGGSDS